MLKAKIIFNNQVILIFGLFLALFLMSACSTESPQNASEERPQVFFDLQSYFNGEIERLNEQKSTVQKNITLQGKQETIAKAKVDFKKELQIFLNSDINKLAWQDKYQVDSTIKNGQLTSLRYSAIDTTLRTKLLEINYQNGAVQQIQVVNSGKSIVAETHQSLSYEPQKGYSIDNEQKTLFSDGQKLQLKVEFL